MTVSFYTTSRWKHKRKTILRRDQYQCQECKRYGKTTEATTVHHVIPRLDQPELRLSDSNLISLCGKCHDKMHDRNTNELTELGRQWVERTERRSTN